MSQIGLCISAMLFLWNEEKNAFPVPVRKKFKGKAMISLDL